MNPKIERLSREQAEDVAVSMLVWLTGKDELMSRFLAMSGLTASSIRTVAGDPGFLAGVADFIMGHEPTLMEFSTDAGLAPEQVAAAHRALHGGEANPWL